MTKRQLQELYWINKNIKKREDRLCELESQATKITTQISQELHGRATAQDKMADVVCKLTDLKNEIRHELIRAYAVEKNIESAIRSLPEREAYLIRLRYIEMKSWEQICVEMNYSWRQVHRIHGGALKLLA